MQSLWLIPVLVAAGPLLGRLYWQRRRQTTELLRLARRRGLNFSPLDLIGLHERYYNLELIRQGHNRHAWSVLYGSAEAGLVAVFRYSYDLGFGVDQCNRHWWVAVLESPTPMASWRTAPAGEASTETGDRPALRAGPFVVHADHAETLARLGKSEAVGMLADLPNTWHVEVIGTLLAIAAPYEGDPATPDRLIGAVAAWSKHLNPTASADKTTRP